MKNLIISKNCICFKFEVFCNNMTCTFLCIVNILIKHLTVVTIHLRLVSCVFM